MTTPGSPQGGEKFAAGIGLRAVRKSARRILPYLFVLYIIAYLDRVNVAFAKTALMADLRFSEAVFGLGAGLFFLGYFLLEIPGALIVERWSARKWIARILVTWGLCTVAVGFVRNAGEFYLARFLLGAAEAGFFPGVIVHLTHWFPLPYRGRALAGFILAVPLSFVIGSPLSGWILGLDGLGMAGWRWLFILEGIPAVVFGILTPFVLQDYPRHARWLEPQERDWLESELASEKQRKAALGRMTASRAVKEPKVLVLALALFVSNIGSSAFFLWLPSTVQRVSGLPTFRASLYTALPFALGMVALVLVGLSTDRTGKPRIHAALAMMICGLSFATSACAQQNFAALMVALCLAAGGLFASTTPFWVLPTLTLGESAAATAIGLINSVGNLGGFLGPTLVGQILSRNYSFSVAVLCTSLFLFTSGVLILSVRPAPIRREGR